MRRFGFIAASPTEFLIHRRGGRTLATGRGGAAFALPLLDRCYLIPCSANTFTFDADQITAENQGVEISGFAVWKIVDPDRAVENFDFGQPARAFSEIEAGLRQVVESAIRHQIANMSVEDALRKRGSIILRLKEELAYMAERWGLSVETVEIRSVRISSEHLFENMQARFRNAMRLESERSTLETEREIEAERARLREAAAVHEQEFKMAEARRRAELVECEAARNLDVEMRAMELESRRLAARLERRDADAGVEAELLGIERRLDALRAERDRARAEAKDDLERIADAAERRRVETANAKEPVRLLAERLPDALCGMSIDSLHLGDDLLRRALEAMAAAVRPGGGGGNPANRRRGEGEVR